MALVKFTSTKLEINGKKGILTPDPDGYYTLIIGGLNIFNTAGEYYALEGAKQLFESSSILMRRIKSGNLVAELGHPKRLPGMNEDAYFNRIMSIDEKNVCAHFKEVWLDETYGRKYDPVNKSMTAIMGKVKPAGPYSNCLEEALNNKNRNVCFSIRALTRDNFVRGVNVRTLDSILTWDYVNEPGISIANKFDSPALETINSTFVTKEIIEKIINAGKRDNVSVESNSEFLIQALESISGKKKDIPIYYKW